LNTVAHTWAGAPAGPVTVVLHGGGPGCHSAADFAAVLALHPERRWLLVDLPGYGDSPAPPAPGPWCTTHARALTGLLDRLDLSTVDFLAQSLGGSVALRLAAKEPDRVRRIVLIGSQPTAVSGSTVEPGLGARIRERYYGGDGPSLAKMRALMAELEWHDAEAIPEAAVLARYRASTTRTALATGTAGRGAPEDLGDALAEVRAPTLVLWGRHDPFAGPDYAAALADVLPRGDLAVLGRTAHHPQSERPDAVAALMDSFLPNPERS
jgi:pimeloyl-ACP methyl ester carboxylesterase